MGIDLQSFRYLLRLHRAGILRGEILTLGRQDFLVTETNAQTAMRAIGIDRSIEDIRAIVHRSDRFADAMLLELGCSRVHSMDASGFEGATIVHDLNRPAPEQLQEQFDVVFDGGTLEHVYNFPVAVQSCLNMVRVGGHFVAVTPCNSFMGHGFYQFSPELFFRVLSNERGFRVREIVHCRAFGDYEWYRVTDPARAKSRICHNGPHPSYLMVCAERIGAVRVDAPMPQQSDYSAEWTERPHKASDSSRLSFFDHASDAGPASGARRVVRQVVPRSIRERLSLIRQASTWAMPPRPDHFTPMRWSDGFSDGAPTGVGR